MGLWYTLALEYQLGALNYFITSLCETREVSHATESKRPVVSPVSYSELMTEHTSSHCSDQLDTLATYSS